MTGTPGTFRELFLRHPLSGAGGASWKQTRTTLRCPAGVAGWARRAGAERASCSGHRGQSFRHPHICAPRARSQPSVVGEHKGPWHGLKPWRAQRPPAGAPGLGCGVGGEVWLGDEGLAGRKPGLEGSATQDTVASHHAHSSTSAQPTKHVTVTIREAVSGVGRTLPHSSVPEGVCRPHGFQRGLDACDRPSVSSLSLAAVSLRP